MSLFGGRREADAARAGAVPAPAGGAARSEGSAPEQRIAQDAGGHVAAATRTGGSVANIGKSIVFKGDLTGDEDLQIEGQVEGGIQLANHVLTIGQTGRAQAQLYAKAVVVVGHVTGNITATERVVLEATASVEGDIHTPKLVIAEGAVLNGAVEMTKAQPDSAKSLARAASGTPPTAAPPATPPAKG